MVWQFIHKKIKDDKKVYLLIVLESNGSSPGREGFKMAVAEDGKMEGSIGGGVMEFNIIENLKEEFHLNDDIYSKKLAHGTNKSKNKSGLSCSGGQTIAFYPFNRSYLPLIESIMNANNGKLVYSERGILFNRELASPKEFISDIVDETKWSLTENLGFNNYIYIVGAGHISIALSKVVKQLGFHVTIMDDRGKHLNSFKANTYADSKKIIEYKKIGKLIPEGDNIYVIIMTFDHKSDAQVLKRLVKNNYRYLGMMGSRTKVDLIFKKLRKKGITDELLENVDAPIGFQINSKTQDEIAISIAAKLIEVKNSD